MSTRELARQVRQRAHVLPPEEAVDIDADTESLRSTARACKKKLHGVQNTVARPHVSKKAPPTWCTRCSQSWPHRTKAEWSRHMLSLRWVKEWRAAQQYWRRVGYDVLWKRSVAVRYRRAIDRRTAIIRELAPRAFSMYTPTDVERFINKYRYRPHGYLCGIEQFKTRVRNQLGG